MVGQGGGMGTQGHSRPGSAEGEEGETAIQLISDV